MRSAAFVLWVALGLAVAMAPAASGDDVLYPVEILLTTTSDWTYVRLDGATLVVDTFAVESGAAAPDLRVTTAGEIALGKRGYDDTRVTVRVIGYLANPSAPAFSMRVGKGHIGDTTVSWFAPGDTIPFAAFRHRGIAAGDPPDNARAFTLTVVELASHVTPRTLAAPTDAMPGGRKVLAFYYPWYGTPSGPSGRWVHWNPAHANYDATHTPASGYYDSLDPETVRRHIRQGKAAGIDGFIASWWGLETFEDRAFKVLLRVAEEESFLVTVYYEIADTPAQVIADVSALVARYAASPAFLAIEGRPVVFFYVRVAEKFTIAEWQGIFSALNAAGRGVFGIGDRLDPAYLAAFDGLHAYNPAGLTLDETARQYTAASLAARLAGRLFAATVIPGYQEGYPGASGPVVPRDGGATYRAYWDLARASVPQWVLITSWNEWHEGSEIEPSEEYGASYLEWTGEEVAAWRD